MENTEEDFFDELLEASLKNADFAKFYAKGRLRRSLAVALLRIRKSAGLTQSKLGEIVGWKQPYVARLERDNSDALAAIERLEQYSSACGVSTMMLFVDKQTGEVKSSLAIGDSPLIQKLAKKMEGALPYEEKENNPIYRMGGVAVLGNTVKVELPEGLLNSGVTNIELNIEEAHPTKKGEEKVSRKYSKDSYGAFLRSK